MEHDHCQLYKQELKYGPPARQTEGTVSEEVAPRSLLVSTEDGAELRRNRRDNYY